MKWGRTYQMIVQGASQQWIVGMPFSCRFQVSSPGTPTANNAQFYLYNLPEKMRNDIVADAYDDMKYRGLVFKAGYKSEPQQPVLFVGNIYWAYSYRQGPDWITEINALDGGFGIATGDIPYNAAAGTPWGTILRALVGAMPGLHLGIISDRLKLPKNARGFSYAGRPWQALTDIIIPTGAKLFILEEKVYILAEDEFLPAGGAISEISDDTGMIGSPRRQALFTVASMIFEPRIRIFQKLTLKSKWAYAGDHKVMRIEHRGTISPTLSDDAVSTVTFLRSPTAMVQAGTQSALAGVAA